jgi:autotransporter translocation and assembly factor TamB
MQAQFALEGQSIDGSLTLAPIPGASINSRISGLALTGDSALHATVIGSLEALQINAAVTSAAANVDLWAVVQMGDTTDVDLDAIVSSADLSGVIADAPASKLDLRFDAHVFQDAAGNLTGSHHLEVLPSVVAGQRTPALLGVGWITSDAQYTLLDGALSMAEPGLDALTTYRVELPADAPTKARVELEARLNNPRRLRALGVTLGRGELSADGDWRSTGQIAVQVKSTVDRVAYGDTRVDRTILSAKVDGTVDHPRATAQVALQVAGGRVSATGSFNRDSQQGRVIVHDVDAAVLARQLGTELGVDAGRLDLNVDVRRQHEDISGKLSATARGLHVVRVGNGDVHAKLELAHRLLNGQVEGSLGTLGKLDLTLRDVRLPSRFDAGGLRTLTGSITARGKVDLRQTKPLLAELSLPFDQLGGQLTFEASAERQRDAEELPTVALSVHTRDLRVVGKRATPPKVESVEAAKDSEPLALSGLDIDLSSEFSPQRSEIGCVLMIHDRRAPLLSLAATAKLPAGNAAYAALAQPTSLPVHATLSLPSHSLANLPTLLRPDVRGFLSGAAEFDGTVLEPKVTGKFAVRSLQGLDGGVAVDVQSELEYTPKAGQVSLVALEKGIRVAELKSQWRGDLRKLSELTENTTPVQANLEAKLHDFPLQLVQVLEDRQVEGRVSGELKLSDWGKDARAELQVNSRSLVIGRIPLQTLAVNARTQSDKFTGEVRVTLPHGRADAALASSIRWGQRPVPAIGASANGRVGAREFELSTLQPLLGRYVSELAGRLNGDVTFRVAGAKTDVAGSLEVNQGVLQLPALGQRFSDISARVAIANDDVRLERLDAAGTTGRLHASGGAQLRGMDIAGAQLEVQIKQEQKIPVTLEGVAIGDAWGTVRAKYVARINESPELSIDVPEFEVAMPDSGGYDLQAMDDNADIRVGVQRQGGKFVALPVQPLELDTGSVKEPEGPPLRVRIKLGDVTVQRGTIATAQLTGELVVVVAAPARVDGRIELRGGQIDVQGKTFEIESGVIAFQGADTSNPSISATARWDSPTDHVVYAEYVGDVRNGRVKLRSEPPLSQDQIASLLLFGTPDGTFGSGDTDQASLAVSVAGGTVAQGLNRALSDFTNLDVSARVDTSTGTSRPELVFQVTPRLAAKVSRAVGEPASGQSPDRTFLTLELRLLRAWALSAVLGDRGATALDLIWRRRY